jgi:hypothetical protein
MVTLKEELAVRFRAERGRFLVFRSLARFNQQVTTKFHLDGSPEEAYLMLGYEPTPVPSRLAFADYTRAAFDWEITPRQLLEERNPMFGPHERQLQPYITPLTEFDHTRWQIVLINNSSLPLDAHARNSLGIMHQATILKPMPERSRVINSTMLSPSDSLEEETTGIDLQGKFVDSQEVARGERDASAD